MFNLLTYPFHSPAIRIWIKNMYTHCAMCNETIDQVLTLYGFNEMNVTVEKLFILTTSINIRIDYIHFLTFLLWRSRNKGHIRFTLSVFPLSVMLCLNCWCHVHFRNTAGEIKCNFSHVNFERCLSYFTKHWLILWIDLLDRPLCEITIMNMN